MEIAPLLKQDFVQANDEIMLSDLFATLKEKDKRAALIFRNKKYMGLIERKKLLKTNLDARNTRVGKFVQATPILSTHASLLEAARALFENDSDYLPVQDDKKIVGVIYALDVVNASMKSFAALNRMSVQDCRSVKPAKVTLHENIATVMTIMREQRVDHVPVFDGVSLAGIVRFRDIVRKYLRWSPKRDKSGKFNKELRSRAAQVDLSSIANIAVGTIATTTRLVKVKDTATLIDAVALLTKHNIRNLIIVAASRYIGLLSVQSILKTISDLEVEKRFSVRYVGVSKVDLTEHQKYALKRIVENSCFKLQRRIKEPFTVSVHLRDIRAKGKQKEFDVGLKVDIGGKVMATQKVDWDLETALHKAFAVLAKVRRR